MHSLYEDATATTTVEQVNHVERDSVLPIAFSLFHDANREDTTSGWPEPSRPARGTGAGSVR